mgnify:CR=1 FL=1
MNKQNNEKIKKLINSGGDLAGSAIGGALGFLSSGPAGAAIGASFGNVVGKVFATVGSDIHGSFISPNEEVRIGAGAAIAIDLVNKRMCAGDTLRSDDFFEKNGFRRSNAEDILEGTLLKCKSAYEELKVKHAGCFFANLAFRNDIDVCRASYLLQTFEKLTYRQLCLIAIFKQVGNSSRSHDLLGKDGTPEQWGILQEVQALKDINFVYQGDKDLKLQTVWGLGAITPAWVCTTSLGNDFYDLFELNAIDSLEFSNTYKLLL